MNGEIKCQSSESICRQGLASGRATVEDDERDAVGHGVLSISRAKMRSGVSRPSENRL
jgi:hypothetical protein